MESTENSNPTSSQKLNETPPVWTYPTRFCRICREDVPATVTLYPPGIPLQFQRPIVEYKNDDEYGRLIKPCKCKGSLRYIHELCLLRSRTENTRAGSMWKCHECGHKFNFKKLTLQRFLSGRIAAAFLTTWFMIILVFFLGFVADPIINIYMDPYDSLTGRESIWDELQVGDDDPGNSITAWSAHFTKGFISMGLVGFIKTLVLNPWHWMNLRIGGSLSSRTTTTGRDRNVNISWLALLIGTCTAFVFLYKWVETFIQRSLARIGNSIVDTQLPDDDDDLKPPPGWKYESAETKAEPLSDSKEEGVVESAFSKVDNSESIDLTQPSQANESKSEKLGGVQTQSATPHNEDSSLTDSWAYVDRATDTQAEASILSGVHRQGWSFANL